MKKSLVIISFAFIFLLSLSILPVVSAEITGDAIRTETASGVRTTSVAESGETCTDDDDCPSGSKCIGEGGSRYCGPVESVSGTGGTSSSTLTTETRTGLEPTPIRKSLSQFSRSSSLGTAWTQVDALGGGTCYVREASSGLRSLFRRSI